MIGKEGAIAKLVDRDKGVQRIEEENFCWEEDYFLQSLSHIRVHILYKFQTSAGDGS